VVKLLWSPMSQVIYTGCLDGKVRAWDGRTGNCEHVYQGHKDSILDIALTKYVSLPYHFFLLWLEVHCTSQQYKLLLVFIMREIAKVNLACGWTGISLSAYTCKVGTRQ
jgi:hypothetical protein